MSGEGHIPESQVYSWPNSSALAWCDEAIAAAFTSVLRLVCHDAAPPAFPYHEYEAGRRRVLDIGISLTHNRRDCEIAHKVSVKSEHAPRRPHALGARVCEGGQPR